MNAQLQALIARTLLGLLLVEIPIVTLELSKPDPDYRFLALGLLGGLAAFLDKQFSPQLASVILPGAVVIPTPAPHDPAPTPVPVSLILPTTKPIDTLPVAPGPPTG